MAAVDCGQSELLALKAVVGCQGRDYEAQPNEGTGDYPIPQRNVTLTEMTDAKGASWRSMRSSFRRA